MRQGTTGSALSLLASAALLLAGCSGIQSFSPQLAPGELEVLEAFAGNLAVECRRVRVAPAAGVKPESLDEPLRVALLGIDQEWLAPLREAALDLQEQNARYVRLTESQRQLLAAGHDPRPGYLAPRCRFRFGRAGLDEAGDLAIGYVVLHEGDDRRRVLFVLGRHEGRWVQLVGWDLDLTIVD